MDKSVCCQLRVTDADFFKPFHAPEVAVLANGTQVKRREAEGLRSDFAVPGIEAPEIKIRFTVRQTARLDGVGVTDQKKEHVAVAGVKRGRVLGDIDIGVVLHRAPIQHARHFPEGVTCAITRDLAHGTDKFVIPDTAIVWPGHSPKFRAAVLGDKGFDEFAAMIIQAMLQVDARDLCRKLAQVGGGCADHGAELTKAPVSRGDRVFASENDQLQVFGVVTLGGDFHGIASDRADIGDIGPALHGPVKVIEVRKALIIRAAEPFGRHAANASAARNIDAVGGRDGGLIGGFGCSFALILWALVSDAEKRV